MFLLQYLMHYTKMTSINSLSGDGILNLHTWDPYTCKMKLLSFIRFFSALNPQFVSLNTKKKKNTGSMTFRNPAWIIQFVFYRKKITNTSEYNDNSTTTMREKYHLFDILLVVVYQ